MQIGFLVLCPRIPLHYPPEGLSGVLYNRELHQQKIALYINTLEWEQEVPVQYPLLKDMRMAIILAMLLVNQQVFLVAVV